FQAMGLTAMEAMACGAAVIVPMEGGATTFARHDHNSLVVDSTSKETCLSTLFRVVRDRDLRRRIQQNAVQDICQFYPEKAAYHALSLLFGTLPTRIKSNRSPLAHVSSRVWKPNGSAPNCQDPKCAETRFS